MVANYGFEIIADSVAPCGKRLTTGVARMPRCILAEWNTHRMFSRNAASSRAIPIEKMVQRVMEDPFIPLVWNKNKPGMQGGEELEGDDRYYAEREWLEACDTAVSHVRNLLVLGVHKQLPNRLLEPWMFTEAITSATEWENFFRQRCEVDKDGKPLAEPHMYKVACAVRDAIATSKPRVLRFMEWHLPYLDDAEMSEIARSSVWPTGGSLQEVFNLVSAARCARVSYLSHDGKRDWRADIELAKKLIGPGHWSPFEHVARAEDTLVRSANFVGFTQFRTFVDHHNFPGTAASP